MITRCRYLQLELLPLLLEIALFANDVTRYHEYALGSHPVSRVRSSPVPGVVVGSETMQSLNIMDAISMFIRMKGF